MSARSSTQEESNVEVPSEFSGNPESGLQTPAVLFVNVGDFWDFGASQGRSVQNQ